MTEINGSQNCLGIEPSTSHSDPKNGKVFVLELETGVILSPWFRGTELTSLETSSCGNSLTMVPIKWKFFTNKSVCCAKSLQLCSTLCEPMDYSPPGSSVHGILQARILEWVAMPPPRDLPNPGTEPISLALADGFCATSATWEAQISPRVTSCFLSQSSPFAETQVMPAVRIQHFSTPWSALLRHSPLGPH